jgi:hypothetical protein
MNRLRAPAAAPRSVYPVKARIEFLISIPSKNAANARTRTSKIAASANSKSASKPILRTKTAARVGCRPWYWVMTIPDFLPFPTFS